VIAGVVSYMFLHWGGFAGLVSLISSPYPSLYVWTKLCWRHNKGR